MEKKLTKKEERIREKEQLSNVITGKMIIVFLSLVLALVLLTRISMNGAEAAFVLALPYISAAFAVLTAAALVWWLLCKKRGTDERRRLFSAPLLLGMAASGLFVSLLYTGLGGAFRMILVLISFALLFFVYQIYSFDFFLCSAAVVADAVAAAVIRGAMTGSFGGWKVVSLVAATLVALAASALCVLLVFRLNAAGRLELFGTTVKKPQHTVPVAIYAAVAVALAGAAASFFLPTLLYCIAAIVVVYLVVAIIYTVKLM